MSVEAGDLADAGPKLPRRLIGVIGGCSHPNVRAHDLAEAHEDPLFAEKRQDKEEHVLTLSLQEAKMTGGHSCSSPSPRQALSSATIA